MTQQQVRQRPRNRVRDFWQLDLPLAAALIICTSCTVVEVTRAIEGNWRAWIYMIEWPMIGAFCIWIWYRFKREAGGGFARRWRERTASLGQEEPAVTTVPTDCDPQVAAWREYQRQVRDEESPSR